MYKPLSVMSVAIIFSVISNVSLAQSQDKDKYCPRIKQLAVRIVAPYRFIIESTNDEGKYFSSETLKYDDNNGPAAGIVFTGSTYDKVTKTLTCDYWGYSMNPNTSLVNRGDY